MNKHTNNTAKDQSGQTLVEFILLMAAIVIISFSFISIINSNISERWVKIANLILDDKNQNLEIP